ncbi:MAG: ABC transporter ATP-binding protein [Treponema sp.]|nr:ABC transporter ATP-binding protein [Treponema sp.]
MIEIEHIYKSFDSSRGRFNLFNDFNLNVKDGTFSGIQGKSGAGKSTLLSIIAGLQKPDSGSVKIDGLDICTLSDKESAVFRNQNIGFISQEQSFLENLTVLDNVRLPSYILSHSKKQQDDRIITERAMELLKRFEISHLASCYPRELSGGENHRVLIARALMNDPKIILADEPTESVDSERTESIIKLFKELAKSGKIVILVSHDNNALSLCDEIVKI